MRPSEALAKYRAELREPVARFNVMRSRVYGSALTGKDGEDSDLDLLVDATSSTTLFTLAVLEHEAQQLLGVQVSVLTPKDLPAKFSGRRFRERRPSTTHPQRVEDYFGAHPRGNPPGFRLRPGTRQLCGPG